MSGLAARRDTDPLTHALDWASCTTVVDVGGGWGPASIALAQRYAGPNFVVQDIEHVVVDGPAQVPAELKGRVTFAAHDFFTPQDVRGADVYIVRGVLHNYPDELCVEVLRAQIPGMHNPTSMHRFPWLLGLLLFFF